MVNGTVALSRSRPGVRPTACGDRAANTGGAAAESDTLPRMLQNAELSPIAEDHSMVALIASLVGLFFELTGGILLGVEDYFKHKDWQQLNVKLQAMKHPALQGIPWFGVITNSTDDLTKMLESLELKHNQTRARVGLWLFIGGILVHGVELCLSYMGVRGF
jgi:hypothetical protein